MPSGEVTLQRIQREIYEVKLREEELRKKYANGGEINGGEVNGDSGSGGEGGIETKMTNGNGVSSPPPSVNGNGPNISIAGFQERPKQQRSLSTPNGTLGITPDINLNLSKTKTRRFAPNSNTKGVMQRFIKSKGKIAALATLTNLPTSNSWSASALEDTISPPKVTLEAGKLLRKGYVPVEERMKKEFQEMHMRESELKLVRRKSQSDLLNMDDDEDGMMEDGKQVVGASKMRSARSVSHLSESDYPDDTQSEPCSLKPARSLAQLCADDDEELDAPGSLTLIRQWESLIQKNQQLRT